MCIAFGKICADFSGSSPTGRCVLQGSHQSIVAAGLPARSAGAEMVEHGAIEPQRHKVFRAAALWAAYATDEIVALINFRLCELRVSQFGRVILCPHPWLRPPRQVAAQFGLAPQSLVFLMEITRRSSSPRGIQTATTSRSLK